MFEVLQDVLMSFVILKILTGRETPLQMHQMGDCACETEPSRPSVLIIGWMVSSVIRCLGGECSMADHVDSPLKVPRLWAQKKRRGRKEELVN